MYVGAKASETQQRSSHSYPVNQTVHGPHFYYTRRRKKHQASEQLSNAVAGYTPPFAVELIKVFGSSSPRIQLNAAARYVLPLCAAF